MKLNKTIKRSYLGLAGCFGVLGLLTVAMLCPISSNGASAVTDDSSPTTSAQATTAQMYIKSVVSLSLQNEVAFDITPTTAGQFGAGTAQLQVSTNSSDGYSLYMKTENGENTLKNASGNTVGAVSGSQTPAGMTKNTWGYALGKGLNADTASYQAIPTASTTPIISTDSTNTNHSSSDNYTLAFGAKIGTDLPTGEYSNKVIVSVIANPETVTSFSQLTYMQEMTAGICASTPEHTDHALIDERDGNSYQVTKLKDGNCWMTQNLALNINQDTGVLASNASGTGTFLWKGAGNGTNNLPKNTETSVPAAVSGGGPQTDTRSWNLGKYVLSNPSDGTSCTVNNGESISKCTRFIDVSNSSIWKPTYQAQEVGGQLMAVDTNAHTYDPHYLIGNYYQFNTATAGTGALVTTDGASASASICPAGTDSNWVLPLSGTMNNDVNGSFYYMLNKYNATSGAEGASILTHAPLSFVRSDIINVNGGNNPNIGTWSHSWSRVSESSTYAYNLAMIPTEVYPSNYGNRWGGFPLRCLYYGSV